MHFNFLIILLYHRLAAPQTGEHNSYANKSDLKSTVISVKVNRNLIENLPANNYTTITATTITNSIKTLRLIYCIQLSLKNAQNKALQQ